MDGMNGEPGPLNEPPALTSLQPTWGSALTQVTIHGSGFATTAGDNHVTFNGHDAMVISAAADTLVVSPNVAVDAETDAVVNVEVANQVSNGLAFDLVPSGTARASGGAYLTLPSGAVVVGGKLYIAGGYGRARNSGLYVQAADGSISQVFGASPLEIDVSGTPVTVYDGPIALATDGTYVFYATALGDVYRFDPSNNTKVKLFAAGPGGQDDFPRATSLLVDGPFVLVLERHSDVVEIIDTSANTLDEVGVSDNIVSIAGNATTLFLVNGPQNRIEKIANPRTTATLTTSFITGMTNPTAAIVNGANLEIACAEGYYGATTASGGTATTLGIDASGSTAISISAGARYFARPSLGFVDRVAPSTTEVVPQAAGLLTLGLGGTRIGDTLYSVQYDANATSFVSEIKPTGETRMLAPGFAIDVIAGDAGTLIVSDCTAHTISSIDIATGIATVLLDDSDGLGCPTGLYRDASGTLFYADALNGTIGSLTAANAHNPTFATITELLPFYLEGDGTTLFVAQFGGNPGPIKAYNSSGVESTLSSGNVNPTISGLSMTDDGRLLVGRVSANGSIDEVDRTSGTVNEVGVAKTDDQLVPQGVDIPSVITSLPDGSLSVMSTYTVGQFADIGFVTIAP
jgi:hypothetical protein